MDKSRSAGPYLKKFFITLVYICTLHTDHLAANAMKPIAPYLIYMLLNKVKPYQDD